MSDSCAVVVPWRAGCPHRERAWAWVRGQHEATHSWEVVVAESRPGPWVKAAAVNEAVARSAAEVIVVADADVWCEGLPAAVEAVLAGEPWAIPHRGVFRLSEHSTDRVLAGEAREWEALGLEQAAYLGWEGGGFVVARRETLLEVPMDERFVGWGHEDESWALALYTLAGRPWRGRVPLVHLWHPPQERRDRRRGSDDNWALFRRYTAVRNDPDAMRALLEEVAACSSPS